MEEITVCLYSVSLCWHDCCMYFTDTILSIFSPLYLQHLSTLF